MDYKRLKPKRGRKIGVAAVENPTEEVQVNQRIRRIREKIKQDGEEH